MNIVVRCGFLYNALLFDLHKVSPYVRPKEGRDFHWQERRRGRVLSSSYHIKE